MALFVEKIVWDCNIIKVTLKYIKERNKKPKMDKSIKELGYMVDCSRGAVPKVETIKRLIDILSSFGYTYFMLYTEDTYEIDGEPYFGYMRGKYSKEEIREIDEYASNKHMELRACIQTLAHLGRLQAWDSYNSLFDIDNILLVKDESVYEFIDKMFKTVSETFKSKTIHIGMDEAFHLGRGRYIDKYGYAPESEIISYHLKRVSEIAKKYGFTCYIWGDMVKNAALKNQNHLTLDIPDNIIPFIWYYDEKGKDKLREEIKLFKSITTRPLGLCGGMYKWGGFAPNNRYSTNVCKEQLEGCREFGIDNFLVSGWGDGASEASQFCILPGLYRVAKMAKNEEIGDAKDFEEVAGMSLDDFDKIDSLGCLDPNVDYNHKHNTLPFTHLYMDLLQDPMMETALDKYPHLYMEAVKKLNTISSNKEFGYMFDAMAKLGKVDSILCVLGRDIRKAYEKGETLHPYILKLQEAQKLLDEFITSHEYQWHKENKSFGYEKECQRLGGLKERMRYVEGRLKLYSDSKIDKIEELEEKHLPKIMYGKEIDPDDLKGNLYRYLVSAGLLNDY